MFEWVFDQFQDWRINFDFGRSIFCLNNWILPSTFYPGDDPSTISNKVKRNMTTPPKIENIWKIGQMILIDADKESRNGKRKMILGC